MFFGCVAKSQLIKTKPKGEFEIIETSQSIKIIKLIRANDTEAINNVLTSPSEYAPPVLFSISGALFDSGKKNEAMFWYYAAQLRARSDANKSYDISSRQAVNILSKHDGVKINKFAFSDIENLKKIVETVVAWDKKTGRNYDPRWIALHGMDTFTESKIRFAPKSQWNKINRNTREQYLKDFYQALELLQNMKRSKIKDINE